MNQPTNDQRVTYKRNYSMTKMTITTTCAVLTMIKIMTMSKTSRVLGSSSIKADTSDNRKTVPVCGKNKILREKQPKTKQKIPKKTKSTKNQTKKRKINPISY